MSNSTLQVVEHVLLFVSEVMPFIPVIGSNGITQAIVKGIQAIVSSLGSNNSSSS